ncbi:MAG: sigma-70 family RNA polymerase sigma factor [Clostridia bacterium]|nr:sigma-70 family RNA polymerase sigma factor [Clostridia bacterium]
MFLPEMLLWLAENGWLMLLHISARPEYPKPLEKAEEQALLERLADGDREAANELIVHNLRLVAHIARKYAQAGVEQDDLISIGSLGLIKAVQTYRPEAGKLTPYAARCIENEILMFFRANRKRRAEVPIGESLGEDGDGNELQLGDLLGTDPELVPEAAETAIESMRALRLMGRVLEPREAEVVRLRCGLEDGEPWPQHRVAERLGISRSYVSRIEKKALEKLRRALDCEEA